MINNRGNLEGRVFCRHLDDSVVPMSYCRDICPNGGDCKERRCLEPRYDSWAQRRVILEKRGFMIERERGTISWAEARQ